MEEVDVVLVSDSGCELGIWTIEVADRDNISGEVIQLIHDQHIVICVGDQLIFKFAE